MSGSIITPTVPNEELIRKLVRRARASGALDGIDGKREFPRFRSSEALELTLRPRNPNRTVTIKMHNASDGGIAFWSQKRIQLHKRIYLRTFENHEPTDWFPAVVCHCTRGIMGFLIGVEFDFTPEK